MESRLGQLLVRKNVLNARQVDRALAEQNRTGAPFGLICERLFDVDPRVVERAWADQYAGLTQSIDLDTEILSPGILAMVTRRQAWQFGVVPVKWDQGELMIATTSSMLVRAHRFVTRTLDRPTFFVMSSQEGLVRALAREYPLPGATLPSDPENPRRHAA